MIAILFGIQGVGKSEIISKMKQKFPEDYWTHMQLGDNAYELALDKGIIKVGDYELLDKVHVVMEDDKKRLALIRANGSDTIYVKKEEDLALARDYMRNVNVETTKILQQEIFAHYSRLLKQDPTKHYLIETHAALKTKQGYLPGLSKDFLQEIQPEVFIIIEADADKIFARRVNDKTRKRDHDISVSDVQVNLDTTRYMVSNYAFSVHSPLVIINNREGEQESVSQELTDILKRFS